ncbi:acyl-coa-binding domain-containing protein 4 [Phtheirospermum japonicum]|uniref:Acyl-coa-binding domain-containing protein 4 n=1 Tax=Phtheirospermum japonicum TaxID=374723 RepID=A0A830D1E6_9LAMI|nr:acyl-coa-binding domain-containing protein 4 [Phtheirospermum japonicum]
MGAESESWFQESNYDQWVALPVSGQRPSARYKHAATIIDEKLYIAGGSRNGRYLSDFQVFDLKSLTWSILKLNMEANVKINDGGVPQDVFPATSGHSMIKWETRLLLLAGLSKNNTDRVTVRFIDLESHNCGVVETFGNIPVARSGQSVTLFGSKLIMFGGEDSNRRLLNDVHVLDLETMTWSAVETTQTPPSPRFDHTAALHAERYLYIFGGCSHSVFFNDLYLLDLETMEWSQPQLQGDLVNARAGHAGVAVEGNWFIVGGGDNKSGALETLTINMSKLVVSVLTSVKGRDPLASEGISISSASLGGDTFLVTFGGYNGKYYNEKFVAICGATNFTDACAPVEYETPVYKLCEVFAMRIKPRDSLHPKILQSPAAAAAAASVTAAYAVAKSEPLDMTDKEDSNSRIIPVDTSRQQNLSVQINSIREEKKALESSLIEITTGNSAIKAKIEEANRNHAELSKELHSVQGQLVAERSRCAKLEAQIGELQKMLESLPSLEREVEALRSQKSAFEHNMDMAAAVQTQQRSGGIWKWVAGS